MIRGNGLCSKFGRECEQTVEPSMVLGLNSG
jgi:hypothetical protein